MLRVHSLLILHHREGRVTFLVNIWLSYKPFNVNPFPETMLDKLSKVDMMGEFTLFEKLDNLEDNNRRCNGQECIETYVKVTISQGKAVVVKPNEKRSSSNERDVALTTMTWPMGCAEDEKICVSMPIDIIRNQSKHGSDVVLVWKDGVQLTGSGR